MKSRLFLQRKSHADRSQHYVRIAMAYMRTSETMKPDSFRSEVVRHIKSAADHLNNEGKRIDGLNWHFYPDGDGDIIDDFNYAISFKSLGQGKYEVTKLGPKADGKKTVDSVAKLRELAKSELHPGA